MEDDYVIFLQSSCLPRGLGLVPGILGLVNVFQPVSLWNGDGGSRYHAWMESCA